MKRCSKKLWVHKIMKLAGKHQPWSLFLNVFVSCMPKIYYKEFSAIMFCELFVKFLRAAFLTLICINWVPGDPRSIFLVTSFTRKMPESSDSMYSSIFMLENI